MTLEKLAEITQNGFQQMHDFFSNQLVLIKDDINAIKNDINTLKSDMGTVKTSQLNMGNELHDIKLKLDYKADRFELEQLKKQMKK